MHARRASRVLTLLVIVFAGMYAFFYASSGEVYHSPDEQAVAVFSQRFAENRTLRIPQAVDSDIVLPRSVNLLGHEYVPGSFLGMPVLIGYATSWFGTFGAVALVPLLAAIAPAMLFVCLRSMMGSRISWISALLLWFNPAWMYFASRAYLPNMGFTAALVIAAGLWTLGRNVGGGRGLALAAGTGLFGGLALAIRPVEAIWVVPLAVLLAVWVRPSWREAGLVCAAAALPLALVGYWQAQTYGAWYMTGYDALSAAGEVSEVTNGAAGHIVQSLWGAIFPFGFHPWAALERFVQYQLKLWWWMLPLLFLGIGYFVKMFQKNGAYKKYAIVFLLVLGYSVLYYGSWSISDHPDPSWVSIGVAYNRYWLPVTVLSIPILAMGLQRLSRTEWAFAAYAVASLLMVFALGPESLWALHANGVKYQASRLQLQQDLSPASVLITQREDKWLWPSFSVIREDGTGFAFMDQLGGVARQADGVYWMTSLPASHAREIEQRVFAPRQFSLEYRRAYQDWALYQIIPTPQP